MALLGVWKKFLSQHLLSKLWFERTVGRRVDDLEETWRLPPFQERNARPAAAALRAAAAALCFKGNHKSSQVVSEVGVCRHQYLIIDSLSKFDVPWTVCEFVVELFCIYLFQHITTNSWVVCIAGYSPSIKHLNEWISETNSDCVDEQVTWELIQSLCAYLIVS